ncbi:MAG TPA: hypothetical protein VEC11_07685 [Allosphingosinicella sp.]|nr:hypothetical protein [Allosphingosinicella sp.]
MKRRLFAPLFDIPRREIRLAPEWLATSLINSLLIGFGFAMIMAVLP